MRSFPLGIVLFFIAAGCGLGPFPRVVRAQSDPVQQLQQLPAQRFDGDDMRAAALWGQQAVRLVAVSPALQELGLRVDDVILAVDGQALGGAALSTETSHSVFTVVRRVPGQRPVLDAATVGRRMLGDFVALEAIDRTPMRLARMVANAWTLMQEGQGVLLLPQALASGDDAWLRWANPLPSASEAGLQRVAEGVAQRAQLPVVPDEAEAARRAWAADDVLVAQERASRALLQWVVDPQDRRPDPAFTALVGLYLDATAAVAARRAELLKPAPLFGVFLEGSYSRIQKMLPQETLIIVENSNGWSGRVGLRSRIVRWLDVLVSYGMIQNDFSDVQGREKIATTVQPLLVELAYRPVVLSYLKPVLRAGFGWYFLDTSVRTDAGEVVFDGTRNTWGLEFGGGLDAFYWKSQKLRGTVMASFRLLEYTFAACDADQDCPTSRWPLAENLPPGSSFDPQNPLRFLDGPPGNKRYVYNMNGWMLGFMLTRNF